MTDVSISRWTMSYFAAALLALIAAESLMAAGYGFPNAALESPETLILVHVAAIGWLSLLMCGALFQFVPVLVARPLYSNLLPLPTLVLLLGGLGTLIMGFLQFAGQVSRALPFFPVSGTLLGLGFGLVIWNLGRTLLTAHVVPLPARFVVVGLFSIAATATLGIVFALALADATSYKPFMALAESGVPIHVIVGLGGWLSLTAMGVTYRLLAMFMLAPELDRWGTRLVLYFGAAALSTVILSATLAILLPGDLDLVLLVSGAIGLIAVTLYGRDILHIYRARKRRFMELNSRMAAFALISFAASVVLLIVLLALRQLAAHVGAVVFLIAFGWLSGLGLSQLYKIVAFLTWLECYGPVLGKTQTPRVQDLVVERRATKWFSLYFLAVWVGTVGLLAGYIPVFQGAAGVMLAATGGIIAQFVRTRNLNDVKGALRLPEGACKPHLLLSHSR